MPPAFFTPPLTASFAAIRSRSLFPATVAAAMTAPVLTCSGEFPPIRVRVRVTVRVSVSVRARCVAFGCQCLLCCPERSLTGGLCVEKMGSSRLHSLECDISSNAAHSGFGFGLGFGFGFG